MKYFILNHKMNLTYPEILTYKEQIQKLDVSNVHFVVVPSFPYLSLFKDCSYNLGSQNVAFRAYGALTGEVSAMQLSSLGVTYTIVAHSERRQIMKETNADFIQKIELLLQTKIRPIFCIGETETEREDGNTNAVLSSQIEGVFSSFSTNELQSIILAYEPVWAIGTGKVAQNKDIEQTVLYIKEFVSTHYHVNSPVLYGGSVNPSNIASLEKVSNIDGYLIGGASLDPKKIEEMLREVC